MADPASTADLIKLLTAGSGGAVIAAIINAIVQRRKIGSDAAGAVSRAATELIDPLREELKRERESNAEEIADERVKVQAARFELSALVKETKELREETNQLHRELRMARLEADRLRQENAAYKRRVQELEAALKYRRKP